MIPPPQTRRGFLRTAARAISLGALGVIGSVLLRRRQTCKTRGGCGACTLADDCSLPWKEAKR